MEIKYLNIDLTNDYSGLIQTWFHLKYFKKVIYTNGLEWRFFEIDKELKLYKNDFNTKELLSIIDQNGLEDSEGVIDPDDLIQAVKKEPLRKMMIEIVNRVLLEKLSKYQVGPVIDLATLNDKGIDVGQWEKRLLPKLKTFLNE